MMNKRLLAAGLAAVMTLSMVACGQSASTGTTGSAASQTSEAPAAGSNTASETGDAAAQTPSGEAFKLGGSGPLTGDAAVYGLAVKNAAEIAVAEINAKGGIQFELNFQDDQADTEAAVNAFNTLADWGMQLSLATVTSGSGQAVSPLYQQENIFGITPSGSSTAIIYQNADAESDPYGNIFQMCFTDPNQGVASADYLAAHSELGTKIGIIYRNDDNYSTGLYTKFKAQAETLGLEIVETQTFTDGATDYSVQVSKLKDAGAEIVFLPIYYQPASQILAEAKQADFAPVFVGCDGMDGILTLKGFDTTLAEGLYMLTPFAADAADDKTQNFVKAYQEQFGEIPNQFAADSYDAVYAISQAIEAEGLTPADDTSKITEGLVKQFTTMTFNGITGTDVTWKESGEVTKAPKAVVVKDGAYVSAE